MSITQFVDFETNSVVMLRERLTDDRFIHAIPLHKLWPLDLIDAQFLKMSIDDDDISKINRPTDEEISKFLDSHAGDWYFPFTKNDTINLDVEVTSELYVFEKLLRYCEMLISSFKVINLYKQKACPYILVGYLILDDKGNLMFSFEVNAKNFRRILEKISVMIGRYSILDLLIKRNGKLVLPCEDEDSMKLIEDLYRTSKGSDVYQTLLPSLESMAENTSYAPQPENIEVVTDPNNGSGVRVLRREDGKGVILTPENKLIDVANGGHSSDSEEISPREISNILKVLNISDNGVQRFPGSSESITSIVHVSRNTFVFRASTSGHVFFNDEKDLKKLNLVLAVSKIRAAVHRLYTIVYILTNSRTLMFWTDKGTKCKRMWKPKEWKIRAERVQDFDLSNNVLFYITSSTLILVDWYEGTQRSFDVKFTRIWIGTPNILYCQDLNGSLMSFDTGTGTMTRKTDKLFDEIYGDYGLSKEKKLIRLSSLEELDSQVVGISDRIYWKDERSTYYDLETQRVTVPNNPMIIISASGEYILFE